MKHAFLGLCIALSLISCRKTITPEKSETAAVVASDANSPLKSHSITFKSDYPVKPGEVPPFTFTKTQYPDSRIKTIYMLSRKNPIHPAFKKEAVELIGTFTYGSNPGNAEAPNIAYLKGTSEVFEYYKNPNGTGAKKSVSKKNVNYKINLSSEGYCVDVVDLNVPYEDNLLLSVLYLPNRTIDKIITYAPNIIQGNGIEAFYYGIQDQYGNLTSFWNPYDEPNTKSYFRVTYDYTKPRGTKNLSYTPSQNLISQEYSLCEVMQWLPQTSHLRKTGGGTFFVNKVAVNQDQVYKNYMFDANGNETSVTYADNVLQKTTWHVQP